MIDKDKKKAFELFLRENGFVFSAFAEKCFYAGLEAGIKDGARW